MFGAAVSAVLLVLALPPADLGLLAPVALVPLLLATIGRGFAFGFVGGMGCAILGASLTQVGVFYAPSLLDGDPGWNYAGFAIFGLVIGFVTSAVGESKSLSPWLMAAWAVLIEAALLLYLPVHLGLTQYRHHPALLIASVGGIWLVSYLLWAMNIALVRASQSRHQKKVIALVSVCVLWGLCGLRHPAPENGDITVGAIQTQSGDLGEIAELHSRASAENPEVVVWPELSALASAYRGDTVELVAVAKALGTIPFVTSFEDDFEPMPHNTAAIFSARGESERYFKRKPFGAERSEHAAGDKPVTVEMGGVRYGLNICFDSSFPSVMRDTVRSGNPNVILLPTLDPIAPYGSIQSMHAAYTPFRAAELGVAIVRADASAYSHIVDRRGVIVAEAGSGTTEVLVASVVGTPRWTVYKLLGDWVLWACGTIALISVYNKVRIGRQSPKAESALE